MNIPLGLSEKEFVKITSGTYHKINDLESLPLRTTHLRYYITIYQEDNTVHRIYKRGGYLIKLTKNYVILGNVPDAPLKRKLKNERYIDTSMDFFTWSVSRVQGYLQKTSWLCKYTVEELAEKYRVLKEKYIKLKSHKEHTRSRSRDSRISDDSTITIVPSKHKRNIQDKKKYKTFGSLAGYEKKK